MGKTQLQLLNVFIQDGFDFACAPFTNVSERHFRELFYNHAAHAEQRIVRPFMREHAGQPQENHAKNGRDVYQNDTVRQSFPCQCSKQNGVHQVVNTDVRSDYKQSA